MSLISNSADYIVPIVLLDGSVWIKWLFAPKLKGLNPFELSSGNNLRSSLVMFSLAETTFEKVFKYLWISLI